MYILKNALKCIGRARGRNILIGIIVLVIAVSACLGLSIRQAAQNAKEETLANMSVTATISFDRQSMMNDMQSGGGFDRDNFINMMGNSSELTLEDYQKYAKSSTVKDFYYSLTSSLNGSDDFEAVSTDTDTESEETTDRPGMPGGMPGGFGGGFGESGDFALVGYSSEAAMTAFINSTAQITQGDMFTQGTDAYDCIISEELAVFNDLSVGNTVTMTNPNNEDETYTLNIVGFYSDTASNTDTEFSVFGSPSSDPANKIYMSYTALQKIINASEDSAITETDETTGRQTSTALKGDLSATYLFANTQDYYQFEEDVRAMGLDDSYTVSSPDIASFENSLEPLNTLSSIATTFLIVILIIGAIILIVLNIFNVRERKYEIGVLTAMGMKKGKVAVQFLTEIFVITIIAVIIGAGIGAVSSVPVTNSLLANQIESQQSSQEDIEANFGRGERPDAMPSNAPNNMPGGEPNNMKPQGGGFGDSFKNIMGISAEQNYIDEISSAMNWTVVWQMLGIAILLTLVAGSVSMLFIMRYEPLKILANRD